MTTTRSPLVDPTQFLIGYQLQREWAWLIAAAFFFGTAGAGLWVVSLIVHFEIGMVVSLVMVGVLKGLAHMLFLGKPMRFPLAVKRWRTSWISRGIIAMFAFLALGVVSAAGFPDGSPLAGASEAFGWAAAVAAAVIMVYDGFVLRACRGIPMWNTLLMPVIGLSYALLGGSTLTLALQEISDTDTSRWLEGVELGLIGLNIVLLATVLRTARSRGGAPAISASLLTKGAVAPLFLVLAIAVGIVATAILAVVSLATGNAVPLVAAGVTDLVGEYFLFFSLLRVGAHPAPRPFPAASIAARAG